MRIRILTCLLSALLLIPSVAMAENGATLKAEETTIELLVEATTRFIQSLTEEQQKQTLFPLESKERLDYKIVPFRVEGIKFKDLKPGQISLVNTIMNAGLSNQGYHKAASIIALDEYLVEIEEAAGASTRFHGTEKYNLAIFGEPSNEKSWAFRMHGHHLYISFTIADGKLYNAGPLYFGASPHNVTEGPRAGWHILSDEENLGRNIVLSLSPSQQKKAIYADKMPPGIITDMIIDLKGKIQTEGVGYSEMNATQQAAVKEMVMEHIYNIPRDQAHTRLDLVQKGGWENIRFAWAGSTKPGEKFFYIVQGPEFILEYCEVEMGSNHIHSVWRDTNGDFGRDILAEHLASNPH
jgi:hypothetical protein